ncbi:MAG: type 2 isopentenyl-diphosphate Delta-isomerase [Gammaproteobacteria bacterium]|nr:type 2 isopentenyl-diphosphate Delta-isomerase [Gammaproteobacteria bacterium]
MSQAFQAFEKRKQDHLRLALHPDHEASEMNAFDAVRLNHEAIPDGQFDEINLSTSRFGLPCSTPFLVSSMTAGHVDAPKINQILMAACQQTGWAMGVGSQRRELDDPTCVDKWKPLRAAYPDIQLMSNIGLAQLIDAPVSQILRLLDAIQAQALIVHCNPLQECIQPEGTPQFKGAWTALEHIVKQLDRPVVVKETGCGFSVATLRRLGEAGVAAIDVSGLGGTHWGRIEGARSDKNSLAFKTAELFKNWGITTVESLIEASQLNLPCEIWASGGIRHGLDAAKAIALGATSVGFAKRMLEAAYKGEQAVCLQMQAIEHALRVAMFCTGSFKLESLKDHVCLIKPI